ncbi:MAG: DinB family protein [Planctomycetota bacterium]
MNPSLALDLFAGCQYQVIEFIDPLPDDRLADQPAGIRNHPAWTLGHLSLGIDLGLTLLGAPGVCPDATWGERMNFGTMPVADRSAYPSRDELLSTYAKGHEALTGAVREADASAFEAVMPVEDYRSFFPTIGHAIGYFLMCHEQQHLGQLVAWRRAAGLAPA